MPIPARPRLLVRLNPSSPKLAAAGDLRIRKAVFKVEPLFPDANRAAVLGFGAGNEQWVILSAVEELDPANPWDLAYEAMREAGATAAEPDLDHAWIHENPTPVTAGLEFAAAKNICQFNPQDRAKPTREEGFGWHLGDSYTQLKAARDFVGEGRRRVRIAHFDTGYDEDHVTLPLHLNRTLQRNFADDDRPDDARDLGKRGALQNPGHGAGTLSLLAGNRLHGVHEAIGSPVEGDFLGGAPHADIVPVRVANSVVLMKTSAFARALEYAVSINCDVLSMSMGGVASRLWTDMVNRAYERGLVMVTAAGNNYGGFPASSLVYPARYERVLAACGVMGDGAPYHFLPIKIMQGNVGPAAKMKTAMAAYTPNVTWAEHGCANVVDMDGSGTSSATPQIAAAAALWLMHHDPAYSQPWMRVEAVRHALFTSAMLPREKDEATLGRGILRARAALEIGPPAESSLKKTREDKASFSFFRVLLGRGMAGGNKRDEALAIEATQLMQCRAIEELLGGLDPDTERNQIPLRQRQSILDALHENPLCSRALRDQLGQELRAPAVPVAIDLRKPLEIAEPKSRALRVYAFDPSVSLDADTKVLNHATVQVSWEKDLKPGPVGEYLEVVDIDPPSECAYEPVDLNHPSLLAQAGLAPSEGNPQFHQQMVYAVAMRTIENFERALGRVALWSAREFKDRPWEFVRRLRIYPHALRQANAFYSREHKALLFGYFPAARELAGGRILPGGMIFTALSHDVIAHETTHALLDGMHPTFIEPSNPDVLAFHEAFSDLVALFQHFSLPEAVRQQIAKTRGNIDQQGTLLSALALQFGQSRGAHGALRDAIAKEASATDYGEHIQPHARGAVLVAAVFDAFLAVYNRRVQDLLRIATNGTGRLPDGEIHPDLATRLAREASDTAQYLLTLCIRALDYCPHVDITFGEYLRALVTADWDANPSDEEGYRLALIEGFRRRGIYPTNVRTLSEESLLWRPPADSPDISDHLRKLVKKLELDWNLHHSRENAFALNRKNGAIVHEWLKESMTADPIWIRLLGLSNREVGGFRVDRDGDKVLPRFAVHSIRPALRMRRDQTFFEDVVVEIMQTRDTFVDPDDEALGTVKFRGGCTLLLDYRAKRIRYAIIKNVGSEDRLARQRKFRLSPPGMSITANYFGDRADLAEPFALLHGA